MAKTTEAKPSWRQNRVFQMRVSSEFLEAIDAFRTAQDQPLTRAQAIRKLVARGIRRDRELEAG